MSIFFLTINHWYNLLTSPEAGSTSWRSPRTWKYFLQYLTFLQFEIFSLLMILIIMMIEAMGLVVTFSVAAWLYSNNYQPITITITVIITIMIIIITIITKMIKIIIMILTGRGLVVTLPVAGQDATEPDTVFTTTWRKKTVIIRSPSMCWWSEREQRWLSRTW